MEIHNTSPEKIKVRFESGVTGFEMKNRRPTCLGLGYRVRNPRLTTKVIGSGDSGSTTRGFAELNGLPSLLDSPTNNNDPYYTYD